MSFRLTEIGRLEPLAAYHQILMLILEVNRTFEAQIEPCPAARLIFSEYDFTVKFAVNHVLTL
jgi:hypothetical protein